VSGAERRSESGRIAACFAALRGRGEAALVPFIVAGDPDLDATRALVRAAADAGADLIELGVPFSDPTADGPVIQRAGVRALSRGTSLRQILEMVAELRGSGVTIILTTHYIEEAELMADRIGVISKGELILVEDKAALMRKLGKKQLTLHLQQRLDAVPDALAAHRLTLANVGMDLVYSYDTQGERTGITALLQDLNRADIRFKDLETTQSSLEDIFIGLVRQER